VEEILTVKIVYRNSIPSEAYQTAVKGLVQQALDLALLSGSLDTDESMAQEVTVE